MDAIPMLPIARRPPPGYAEIEAASGLHPDSGAWAFFMRHVVRLPREMTPAVSDAIRKQGPCTFAVCPKSCPTASEVRSQQRAAQAPPGARKSDSIQGSGWSGIKALRKVNKPKDDGNLPSVRNSYMETCN